MKYTKRRLSDSTHGPRPGWRAVFLFSAAATTLLALPAALILAESPADKVRKTPSWPGSWANFSLL